MRTAAMGGVVSLTVVAVATFGCATIMHGTSQGVSIASAPAGAAVTVDNQPVGNTPVVAKLKRKHGHHIVITADGYQPFELKTTRATSGWVWGNIVFGGLIGLAVDAMTGGLYVVKPDQVSAELQRQVTWNQEEGGLFVVLVPRSDPQWTRIGQLQPR